MNSARLLSFLCLLLLPGCHLLKRQPSIKSGGITVTAPTDTGKAGTLGTAKSESGVDIPEDTPVEITRTDAKPATETAPFEPERWTFKFTPTKATRLVTSASAVQASTGTVDTTVALKRIEAEENRIWLYASLVAAAVGIALFMAKYPGPAAIAGIGSAAFFMVWKVSSMPPWFWAVGVVCVVVGPALWWAHERGEKHAKQSPTLDVQK